MFFPHFDLLIFPYLYDREAIRFRQCCHETIKMNYTLKNMILATIIPNDINETSSKNIKISQIYIKVADDIERIIPIISVVSVRVLIINFYDTTFRFSNFSLFTGLTTLVLKNFQSYNSDLVLPLKLSTLIITEKFSTVGSDLSNLFASIKSTSIKQLGLFLQTNTPLNLIKLINLEALITNENINHKVQDTVFQFSIEDNITLSNDRLFQVVSAFNYSHSYSDSYKKLLWMYPQIVSNLYLRQTAREMVPLLSFLNDWVYFLTSNVTLELCKLLMHIMKKNPYDSLILYICVNVVFHHISYESIIHWQKNKEKFIIMNEYKIFQFISSINTHGSKRLENLINRRMEIFHEYSKHFERETF